MDTKLTNKYPIGEAKFNEIIKDEIVPRYESNFKNKIINLSSELANILNSEGNIYFEKNDIYLDCKSRVLWPNIENYEAVNCKIDSERIKQALSNVKIFGGLSATLPMLSTIRSKRIKLQNVWENGTCFMAICDNQVYKNHLWSEVAYDPYENNVILEKREAAIMPVCELKYITYVELLVKYLVPYGLVPSGLSQESNECINTLIELYKVDENTLSISEKGIEFSGGKILSNKILNDKNEEWFGIFSELTDVLKKCVDTRNIDGDIIEDIGEISENKMDIKEKLLNCEKKRADIDPYEERILTDPNRGHWDLWFDEDNEQHTIQMKNNMVARNPICDINENGVIAIDFGTKSTIVVYQSDIEHSLPMGIGDGNLSKEPTPKRYENPTVMHFVDLETFLKDYKSKEGRPETKWENLTISHTAMDQFDNSKSSDYYEYLHQIKQWAGQREKKFRIKSHTGESYVLPSFLDMDDNDWNPIEIYAYYIGLYINNMRKGHGIFLDYYLSFPVTYEKRIREKIVKSFEKGLKKSLPTQILKNEDIMKRFKVNGDISEPAAYAVCALQEYGFEPNDDEEIFYGIFDFGGGTTDFDFGLWKQSAKRKYDYTIENFGAGGDEFLGGENLLEMLAFEVFKENQNMMRDKGYTFTLAPKCTEFLGSDSLLADSQEAEKNMHNLMEKIRPYWEIDKTNDDDVLNAIEKIRLSIGSHPDFTEIDRILAGIREKKETDNLSDKEVYNLLASLIDEYDIKVNNDDDLKFTVTLFNKEGQDQANEELHFSRKRLYELIENRIREGVNNFFSALLLSYQNDKVKKPTTVNILLAGNSCKSPIVKKIFEEEIGKIESEIKEKNDIKDNGQKFLEIFPPLGTEEAYKKMEARGIEVDRNNYEKPTGKTGVAFGLIQCRKGGTIERIVNNEKNSEIPFQYFIGWRSKKKFVAFRDESKTTKYRGKPDYNVWYKFIEADDSVFELYYTTLPECVNGNLAVDGNAAVKRLRCELDVVDDESYVYIRAVDPHTLEYVVALDDNVNDSMLGNIVRKEL